MIESEKQDVIVVLGGGLSPHGELNRQSKARVRKAVEHYRSQPSPMLFSGGQSFQLRNALGNTESEAMKKYASSLDVQDEILFAEKESFDTLSNAWYCKAAFLEPFRWRSLLLVTSEYHMERSLYLFTKILGPDYRIKTLSAPASPSAVQRLIETKMLAFSREQCDDCPDGDSEALATRLNRFPGHPSRTLFNGKELRKLVRVFNRGSALDRLKTFILLGGHAVSRLLASNTKAS